MKIKYEYSAAQCIHRLWTNNLNSYNAHPGLPFALKLKQFYNGLFQIKARGDTDNKPSPESMIV